MDKKPDFTTWKGWVLPILVGGTQFLAVSLSMYTAKKKGTVKKKDSDPNSMAAQMEQMQGMMKWIMPVMIGFFTATFQAGVGIYWLTSTIFGIFQQKYVNFSAPLGTPSTWRYEEDHPRT